MLLLCRGQVRKHGGRKIPRHVSIVTTYVRMFSTHTSGFLTYVSCTDRCVDCPVGTYGENIAATSLAACTSCPAGKFSAEQAASSDAACSVCGSNLYSEAGSTTCHDCPLNSVSSPETPSIEDCTCIDGFVQSVPGSTCYDPDSSCPKGTYQEGKSLNDAKNCVSCPVGTSSDAMGACCFCLLACLS